MGQRGFSLIELFTVLVLIGVITMIGFPRIRDALDKTNVRSARVAAGTYVATVTVVTSDGRQASAFTGVIVRPSKVQ